MTKKKSLSDLQQELDKLSSKISDDLPRCGRWKEAYQKCNKARMFLNLKRNRKNIIELELLDAELILEYKMMLEQNKVLVASQYKKIMNLDSPYRYSGSPPHPMGHFFC